MTLHPKMPRKPWAKKPPRRPTPPLTIGHVLGAAWEAKKATDKRRAELDDMGFKPLGGA